MTLEERVQETNRQEKRMSLSICSSCPSTLRSHCSRFNYSLHHPKKKDVKPVLSEFERVCIFLKSIYVAEGKEYVFYEGGVMELGLTRDSTCGVGR
jgi:hypothetical protein